MTGILAFCFAPVNGNSVARVSSMSCSSASVRSYNSATISGTYVVEVVVGRRWLIASHKQHKGRIVGGPKLVVQTQCREVHDSGYSHPLEYELAELECFALKEKRPCKANPSAP